MAGIEATGTAPYADVIIANEASLLHLRHALDRLARSASWPTAAPRLHPVAELGIPQRLTRLVDQLVTQLAETPGVDMVAVTGSGGRGKYQHGWSDTLALPAIQRAAGRLRQDMSPVRLGLTLVTTTECQAGALTPRLIHTLRQLTTGGLGAQWSAPSLRLPCPPADVDADTSLADGTLTAIELRRQLLQPTIQPRSVFKQAALLAKVMLRLSGDDP